MPSGQLCSGLDQRRRLRAAAFARACRVWHARGQTRAYGSLTRAVGYGASKQATDRERAHGGQVRAQEGSTGKFRFNLVAPNGQVIATSEADESKASAINGIESVTRNAATAAIDDQTDK